MIHSCLSSYQNIDFASFAVLGERVKQWDSLDSSASQCLTSGVLECHQWLTKSSYADRIYQNPATEQGFWAVSLVWEAKGLLWLGQGQTLRLRRDGASYCPISQAICQTESCAALLISPFFIYFFLLFFFSFYFLLVLTILYLNTFFFLFF